MVSLGETKKDFCLPSWVMRFISHDEVQALAKRVSELEKDTSVEIVTMVVGKSSATRHVVWILLLIFLCAFFEINVYLFPQLTQLQEVGVFALEMLMSFSLSHLFSRMHFFQRLLTHDKDLQEQVAKRAQVEFHGQNLTATEGRTGVLIFISLMEHRVMILADKSIVEKLPKETWTNAVNELIAYLRKGQLAEGITKAVEHVSKLVTPIFPAQDSNPNELTDYVIIEGATSEFPDKA